VRYLFAQKRDDDAKRWAAEGIARTSAKLPGIATELIGQLCEAAQRANQWDIVAAHAANLFFGTPGKSRFNELMAAAEKVGCPEAVRRLAVKFLETGVSPIRLVTTGNSTQRVRVDPDWPLPVPEYLVSTMPAPDTRHPVQAHHAVLIEMAIADKRPDDVLRWYDQWRALRTASSSSGGGWFNPDALSDTVANAVAASHPRRAVDIHRGQVDRHLTITGIGAYETVASYLLKMKPILAALDCDDEWTELVRQIRERYRNRPRFMEILDRLDGRPIASKRGPRG